MVLQDSFALLLPPVGEQYWLIAVANLVEHVASVYEMVATPVKPVGRLLMVGSVVDVTQAYLTNVVEVKRPPAATVLQVLAAPPGALPLPRPARLFRASAQAPAP